MLPRDLCRIERPTDTKWISGQQRQGFQQKTRTKATKQKQCISNPQNDNLMKIKIRKRYRWLQKKITFFSREPSQGFVAQWLMRLSCKQEIDGSKPSEAWKTYRAYKLAETPHVEDTFKLHFY